MSTPTTTTAMAMMAVMARSSRELGRVAMYTIITGVSTAATTAPNPLGRKPPQSTRCDTPLTPLPGSSPNTASRPRPMNATMATTLSSANQNSNSRYAVAATSSNVTA